MPLGSALPLGSAPARLAPGATQRLALGSAPLVPQRMRWFVELLPDSRPGRRWFRGVELLLLR